jgi:hypothetical protein
VAFAGEIIPLALVVCKIPNLTAKAATENQIVDWLSTAVGCVEGPTLVWTAGAFPSGESKRTAAVFVVEIIPHVQV